VTDIYIYSYRTKIAAFQNAFVGIVSGTTATTTTYTDYVDVYPAIPILNSTTTWDMTIFHKLEKEETLSAPFVEFLWSPPLSLWQDTTHAIPTSTHEFKLTANKNWNTDCLQFLNEGNNKDMFDVRITDFKLFIISAW
jgi:hypothetical protein